MYHRILSELQDKELFWSLRNQIERKVAFPVLKKSYEYRFKMREEKASSRILYFSLRKIFRAAFLAAIFVLVMEIFSRMAKDISFHLGDDELGLLISTVVTVSGVFLGLYFTALSAVAGNLFMRAPTRLQNLFLRDRKGSQYVQTLALTLVIGTYYLLLRAFGYEVGFIGPVVVTFLAVYAIIRFIALGAQTFYFIHPAEACSTLISDAVNAIDDASYKGLGKKKQYLQYHYHKQAREALNTLDDLVAFGVNPVKLSGQQLLEISQYTGGLMGYYLGKKKRIQTQSNWFAKKYEHQKWLISDDSSITLALASGVSLEPKEVKDALWFERKSLSTILSVFSHLCQQKDWGHAQACLEVVVGLVEQCGNNFDFKAASLLIENSVQAIDKALAAYIDPEIEEDQKGRLAILDSLGRLPIGALVSLNRYLDSNSWASLDKNTRKLKWSKSKVVYFNKLPGALLEELERTHRQFTNEIKIEGHRVSPDWYLQTITVHQYLINLNKYYELVKLYNDSFYKQRIERLVADSEHLQAAHLTNRWLEFTNKLLSLGSRVHRFIEDCNSMKKVHDLPWVTIDGEKEKLLIQDYNKQAFDMIAQLIVPLSVLPRKQMEDLPDYFGQALISGFQAAYDAARSNDVERLKKVFPGILIGSLSAKDKIRNDVEGWLEQSQLILITEPLEDLLSISGYIKIYSELFENPALWRVCEETWNSYLDLTDDPSSTIKMFVTGMRYRDSQMGMITPRAIIRTTWDQQLGHTLEENGISVDAFHYSSDRTIDHPSPIIRIVAKHALLSFEARNIFFITYMKAHPAALGIDIDFPDGRDFENALNQEISRTEEGEHDES